MPIDYHKVKALRSSGASCSYTDKETILYALGIGMGRDSLDERELPFVYEKALKAIPSMATVLGAGGNIIEESGITMAMTVHGEQRLECHRPLPPWGTLVADSAVEGLVDKGDKGALLFLKTTFSQEKEAVCTLRSTVFARADGNFGGQQDPSPTPHPIPERKPDHTEHVETRMDQALLYRLSGDRNPLHSDPAFAKMAGFPRPILHGLCSYGISCRVMLKHFCDYHPDKIRIFDVRFSAPVFPGQKLTFDIWEDGKTISFIARVDERVVLNNGKCVLA